MSKWIKREDRLPKAGQWIVVPWDDGFKCGQFDPKHPFAPCIVDRMAGKFYRNFEHWKPLTGPRAEA